MREETADTVLHLLPDAVDYGIAQPASIPGYSVAGKTGTAEIAGPITSRVRTGTDAHGKPIYKTATHFGYIDGWIDSSLHLHPAGQPIRSIVTLLLIHRPSTWGLYQMAQTPGRPLPRPRARRSSTTWPSRRTGPSQPVAANEAARLGRPVAGSRVPPSIRLDDLVAATGGRLLGPTTVTHFTTAAVDSRHVIPGCLLRGAAGRAGRRARASWPRPRPSGATVALVERPVKLPPGSEWRVVQVPDTLTALQELAAWWRSRSACGWWASPARPARRSPRRSWPTSWPAPYASCATRATSTPRPACR